MPYFVLSVLSLQPGWGQYISIDLGAMKSDESKLQYRSKMMARRDCFWGSSRMYSISLSILSRATLLPVFGV